MSSESHQCFAPIRSDRLRSDRPLHVSAVCGFGRVLFDYASRILILLQSDKLGMTQSICLSPF